jgi:stage II sporulation protein E
LDGAGQWQEEIPNGLSNMYLSGDGISLLNAVESQSNRLRQLRMDFIGQLGQIGAVISAFPQGLPENSLHRTGLEQRIIQTLRRRKVRVSRVALVGEKQLVVHLCCRQPRGGVVTGAGLAEEISHVLNRKMICLHRADERVDQQESRFSFVEEGRFFLTTGIVRKNRQGEVLCGDNFSVSKVDTQEAVFMLADGMGWGSRACRRSTQLVELLERLLMAGFPRELTIQLLNSCLSFVAGGNMGTSLDLTVVNLYTGTTDFLKLGASATFIKRKNQVECIQSRSLPVGLLEQVEFDTCVRRLYDGDMIIMLSDGVMDGLLRNRQEETLMQFLAGLDTRNAQAMANHIMEELSRLQPEGLLDDSTVLVAGVWEHKGESV